MKNNTSRELQPQKRPECKDTQCICRESNQPLEASHIDDLRKAASKMHGAERRGFQAEMSLKYCRGIPRETEKIFGWNRNSVKLGLHEKRAGITCLGAHKACCGHKLWEEKHPEVAAVLFEIAETNAQQDPTFRTTLSFTRLTAAEALKQLQNRGFMEQTLPSPRTMADVLNRNGYRLRPVLKAKPQKKFRKQTPSSTISKKRTDNVWVQERQGESVWTARPQ
jgi:hypothetical protein